MNENYKQLSDFHATGAVTDNDLIYSQNVTTGIEQKSTVRQLRSFVENDIAGNLTEAGALQGTEMVPVGRVSLYQITLNKLAAFIMGKYAPQRQSIPVTSNSQSAFVTNGYTVGLINVYVAGIRLNPSMYQAIDGSTITITSAKILAKLTPGMTVDVEAAQSIAVANVATPASVAALDPSNQPAVGTLTGTELLSIRQGTGLFQSTLTKVATWIVNSFQGYLQFGVGAVNRTLVNKMQDVVSVRDFGAVGDGVTDDTAAIQAALYSVQYGGVVLLTRSTYAFTHLTLPVGVVLRGETSYASVLLCTTTTGDVITLGSSAKLEDLKLTASSSRTNGRSIVITANGSAVRRCEMSNYYIGIDVNGASSVATNAVLESISFSNPSVTAGGGAILGSNYANLVINKIEAAGLGSGATQPSWGIRLLNGDTCFISDTNVTLHGAAFKPDPLSGQNVYATSVSNSFFDSAVGHSCAEFTCAGNVYDTKISNTWFGLANTGNSGCLISPTGAVDGVDFSGCEFVGNGDSGLRVNGATAINIFADGGWASGNTYGYNFSGGCTHFRVRNTRAGNVSGRGPNTQYGCIVQAGASDYYDISNNDFNGNTVGGLSDNGAGTHKNTTPNLT